MNHNFQVPEIGAEVFIERGQTEQEIDTLFCQLKNNGMTITRIRLFEPYMRTADGQWDFSLFDRAFAAGDKYGIKIYGNLFPDTSFEDVGGFKFPRDNAHFASIREYIKNVVPHFSLFKSCVGWVPINEIGSGSLPKDEFTQKRFEDWKEATISDKSSRSGGYEHLDFAEDRFLWEYNTWYLEWLCDEIRKYNPDARLHVNGHALFNSIKEYDFPKWRRFLSIFGGSAHASWHFGNFERDRYSIAMSATSEIIRSGAGNLPWFMTEIQGGNNIFSALAPLCPTAEEIAQWLWIILFSEAKGAMFWCLNPRASGFEAGEWAMLNYQYQPSDRMIAASGVIKTVNQNASLFSNLKEEESGLNILYVRETMWVENKLNISSPITSYQGRSAGAGINSSLAYFEALCEMGIQCNFKEICEFDFLKDDYTGVTIILSQQVAIPRDYNEKLIGFVAKGGRLIMDGLSDYYDENAICQWMHVHPLAQILGGSIKEYKMRDDLFPIKFSDPNLSLSAHLWQGSIERSTGVPISGDSHSVYAVKNNFGKGMVVWVPTPLGLGAWVSKNFEDLSQFILHYVFIGKNSLRFEYYQKGLLMKTVKAGNATLTMIVNKSPDNREVQIINNEKLHPEVIFSNKGGMVKSDVVKIASEETLIVVWN